MKKLLLCLLFPLLAFGAPPAQQYTLDIQNPDDWPRGLKIRQATTPRIDFRLVEQGSVYTNLTGATAVFHYYKDRDDGTVQVTSSEVTPADGLLHIDFSAEDSNTNGAFKAELLVSLNDEAGTEIQWGRGRIEIEKSVASGVDPATLGSSLNYGLFTSFSDVASSGPYRAGTNVSFSSNVDGSVDINSTLTGGGSGDLTEVQVSGGLLTVASGTGPVPIVGLTTASLNSAESDPNAVLLTGAQTVAGEKTFSSPLNVTGGNINLEPAGQSSRILWASSDGAGNVLTAQGPEVIRMYGDFNPFFDSSYDLGSASKAWLNMYSDNFIGSGASLTNIGFSGFDTDVSDTMKFVIGTYLDSPEVSVASDGATITLSIEQSGGGDLRVFFSDGVYTEDTTPAAAVTLTAGSDTVPQINYVYLLQSNKTLTASTSGWPATEHAPVATVLAQSAASLQTDGAYKLHAWTDHIKSDDEGHLSHINFWIRSQPATWIDGIALTPTAGAGQLDIATTSGNVLQLHPHDFPAFDTDTLGSRLMTVNYPGDNYKEALDLTQTYIDVDANGDTLGDQATDFYNLVVWGVVSEGGANSHLMINLPDGSYNSDAGSKASDDTENTAVYDIPSDFTGVGFLIARLTIQESAGTYTIIRNTDLRGQTPATSAGGGATGGNEFADSVFRIQDTDDVTREIAFDAGTITTGNTRTFTAPDESGTLVVSGSIGPTEISVGYSESNPYVIPSSATPSILIENGPFQKLTQAQNITSITWGFGGTSNGGNISLELIDGDSYTQVWGVGNWVGGSNGTIENPWEQVIFHGTNSTALTGAELDADL